MADETGWPPDAKGPGGGEQQRRRRRRRRGGGGRSPEAAAASGQAQAQPRPERDRDRPRERERERDRDRGPRDRPRDRDRDRERVPRPASSAPAPSPSPGATAGPTTGAAPAPAAAASAAAAAVAPPLSDIDAGWDDVPAPAPAPATPAAPAGAATPPAPAPGRAPSPTRPPAPTSARGSGPASGRRPPSSVRPTTPAAAAAAAAATAPAPDDAGWDAPSAPAAAPEARWGEDDDTPAKVLRLEPLLPAEASDPDGELVFLADDFDAASYPGTLTNVAGVTFHSAGKIYEMDAGDASYARGDRVVVEGERGVSVATVAIPTARQMVRESLRRILRKADARDLERQEQHARRAEEMLRYAKERVRERRMPIKMFRVEMLHGGAKAVFYFSSEDRIDFRDLVRDFSHKFHLRVEMRQTGVRDEAKLVGGIGSCGRELCCTTWLPRFDPISIKAAKDQGLVLNPSKISGQCGRLKCCLLYEQATYAEMRRGLPKVGKRVATPAGEGRVAEVDVLRQRVRVSFAPGEFETFPVSEVTPLAPPPEGPQGGDRRALPAAPPDEPPDEPGDGPA